MVRSSMKAFSGGVMASSLRLGCAKPDVTSKIACITTTNKLGEIVHVFAIPSSKSIHVGVKFRVVNWNEKPSGIK